MRDIKRIIIHCSDTPFLKDFSAADIDKWHRERNFDCIGYHYVICLDGSVQVGRPLQRIGAHCKGYNSDSIGICYIGGRNIEGRTADTRTEAQKISLRKLVYYLHLQYPNASVHGHNEFANKACPCFDVSKESNWFTDPCTA